MPHDVLPSAITKLFGCFLFCQILLGLRQALELAASTKSLVDKISLGVEVGLITNQLGENLAASALVQDTMDGLELLLKGVPHYRDDKRRELQVVTQLRYSLEKSAKIFLNESTPR